MNILNFKNIEQIKRGLSKKKIFRKKENKINKIIIDFSNDNNDFKNFINVYNILKDINISIPKIYEIYFDKKLIIMEDFGERNFDKLINEKELYNLLKLAVDNIIIIQNSINQDKLSNLKKYNYNELKKEISEFVDYYIPYKKILNFPINNFFNSWKKIYDSQNFVFNSFAHKDFEFINLIFLDKRNLHLKCGIIDFQAAFLGFKGWDLLSVLENSRVNFTRKYNEDFIKYFYQNVNINTEFDLFRNHYYLFNLARQTRLLGRWVKLFKEGNDNYLDYINPTKKRISDSLINIKDQTLKEIYEMVLIY